MLTKLWVGTHQLNIPRLTSLAFINLYQEVGGGTRGRLGDGEGLDRSCDKVCLLRYHTVIKGLAVSHGHYSELSYWNYFYY